MTLMNALKNANFGKLVLLILFALFGSSQSFAAKSVHSQDQNQDHSQNRKPARNPTQIKLAENLPPLPKNIQWVTNDSEPEFASPKAVRGGMLKTFMPQFPMTLRDVGPDANGSFRSYFDQNKLSLLELHPNTRKWIPQLATHWAFDKDNKTIYFKLNPKAKWSDGVPVTADDYVYVLEFMRSKHIVAPWYNNYYTEFYDKIVKYDDHTIAVVGKKPFSEYERVTKYNMGPLPKHFYGELNENFVKDFNWKVAPVTGPYIISEVRKGKYIVFKRIDDWWANNERYYRYRYNIDKFHIKVIRDLNVAYRHFLRGNLDVFAAVLPDWWHGRTQGKEYDAGYIVKHWFFNDAPASDMGMWFNTDKGLLKDIRIRKGISHSINVEKVIKSILRNDYERLSNGDQGKGPWYNPHVKAREFDIKAAVEQFEAAGFTIVGEDGIRKNKQGQRLSFTVTYGQKHHNERLVMIKEEARKTGLELVLNLMDGSTAFKTMLEKQHEIAWSGWSTGMLPSYWEGYHSENAHKPQTNNLSNADDKELDTLIKAFDSEFDDKKKINYAHQIQQKIYDMAYYLPTFRVPYAREVYWRYWRLPEVAGTQLSDVLFDLAGPAGGLFWLDKGMKEETLAAMKEDKKFEAKTIIDETYRPKP